MESVQTYFLTLVNTGKKDDSGRYILEWHKYLYDDDFHALQKQVGGYFEHFDIFPPRSDAWLDIHGHLHIDSWVNDEGKVRNLPPTIPLLDTDGAVLDFIAGNICFIKSDEIGESYGLKLSDMGAVMRAFHFFFELPFDLHIDDFTGLTGCPDDSDDDRPKQY